MADPKANDAASPLKPTEEAAKKLVRLSGDIDKQLRVVEGAKADEMAARKLREEAEKALRDMRNQAAAAMKEWSVAVGVQA